MSDVIVCIMQYSILVFHESEPVSHFQDSLTLPRAPVIASYLKIIDEGVAMGPHKMWRVGPTYILAPLEFWTNFDFTLMIICKKRQIFLGG